MSEKSLKKILIISHDKIGTSMAGPGIRYHHMAEFLASDFDVTVGFFDDSYMPDDTFERSYQVVAIDGKKFTDTFQDFNIIISLWLNIDMMDFCNAHGIFIVFDVYAPVPVENLALFLYNGKATTRETDFAYTQACILYEKFFANGDLFLFSNRRQLDYWIGFVFGADLIRVSAYKKRSVFDRFIYAAMGMDTSVKIHTEDVMRGRINGVNKKDKILLWTGGIWNWFDAQTLIKAMSLLRETRPDIKLVFLGTKHPNPNVPEMQETTATHDLAEQLGVLNETVFMKEGWVRYDQRLNYLLEADAAIYTTKQTIESEFSHRTRVLDHIWAELPTLATQGDFFSDEIIETKQLGFTVPPGDEKALAAAIIKIFDVDTNKAIRRKIATIKDDYSWDTTLQPLRDALKGDLPKLNRVPIVHVRPSTNKFVRAAKRMTPSVVKKVIIRVLHYGN